VKIVGAIPQGLPVPETVSVTWTRIKETYTSALIISLIGFMEAISVAKKFAALRQYKVNVSKELIALGLANMMGAVFQAYPATGSISRSAVNYRMGIRTPLSSFLVGILMMGVLLFLTPLFYYTPSACLAAIVIAAAVTMVDTTEMIYLYKIKEYTDLAQLVVTLLITLLLGPDVGAGVAVAISLILVVLRSSKPNFVVLGRLPGTLVYKDVNRFPDAVTQKGVLIVRFDSRIFFYTTTWFRERLDKWEREAPSVHTIVIDSVGINSIDSTGVHVLTEVLELHHKKNIRILFSDVKGPVRDAMENAGLTLKIGLENFFLTTHSAVEYATAAVPVKVESI